MASTSQWERLDFDGHCSSAPVGTESVFIGNEEDIKKAVTDDAEEGFSHYYYSVFFSVFQMAFIFETVFKTRSSVINSPSQPITIAGKELFHGFRYFVRMVNRVIRIRDASVVLLRMIREPVCFSHSEWDTIMLGLNHLNPRPILQASSAYPLYDVGRHQVNLLQIERFILVTCLTRVNNSEIMANHYSHESSFETCEVNHRHRNQYYCTVGPLNDVEYYLSTLKSSKSATHVSLFKYLSYCWFNTVTPPAGQMPVRSEINLKYQLDHLGVPVDDTDPYSFTPSRDPRDSFSYWKIVTESQLNDIRATMTIRPVNAGHHFSRSAITALLISRIDYDFNADVTHTLHLIKVVVDMSAFMEARGVMKWFTVQGTDGEEIEVSFLTETEIKCLHIVGHFSVTTNPLMLFQFMRDSGYLMNYNSGDFNESKGLSTGINQVQRINEQGHYFPRFKVQMSCQSTHPTYSVDPCMDPVTKVTPYSQSQNDINRFMAHVQQRQWSERGQEFTD